MSNLTKREIVLQIYRKSGFPQKQIVDTVQQTLDIVHAAKFDGLFGFKYSPRPGTIAARLIDDVPEVEKSRRLADVFAAADVHRDCRLAGYHDTVQQVLVEGPSKHSRPAAEPLGPLQLMGRTRTNLIVNFPIPSGSIGLSRFVGQLVNVKITRVFAHSLFGELELVH